MVWSVRREINRIKTKMSKADTRRDTAGAMPIRHLYEQDLTGCFLDGDIHHGGGTCLSRTSYRAWLEKLAPAL